MKRNLLIIASLVLILLPLKSFSLTDGILFYNFARDNAGNIITATSLSTVNVKVYNTTSATYPYEENFSTVSVNEYGLFAVKVGTGTPASGSWGAITFDMSIWVMISIEITPGSGFIPIQSITLKELADQMLNQANTDLSNLRNTAINADLVPANDNSINLGSSSKRWNHLYVTGSTINMGTDANHGNISYDGTDFNFDKSLSINGTTLSSTQFDGNAATATTATNLAGGGTGSLPYQSSAGNTAMLTAGSNGQVLTLNSGVPSWQNAATNTATYRWAVFSTFNETIGWVCNNDPNLFGGVSPSNWTDGGFQAVNISSNKEHLRTLFTQKGYAKSNAMVYSDTWYNYSSTNGKMVAVLFRIRNTTGSNITWTPNYWVTGAANWGEIPSASINGSSLFAYNLNGQTNGSINITIPPNRTSTVIFVSASSYPGGYLRTCLLAFYNNSLALPQGLQFIDDLDTATGGWEQ